jgi:molecular chaperone GrpE
MMCDTMAKRKKNKEDETRKATDTPVEEGVPAASENSDRQAQSDMQKEIDDLKRQVAEKTELAQAYFAQLQRVQADFENFQKRVDSEKSRIADNACETIVSGLLETLDNFERAIGFLEKLPEEESKGVLMVYQNMLEYLRSNGLERIATAGCQFDPRKHEAIMQSEVEGAKDGTVLEEFQVGYSLKGKVIRPSRVKVAREKKITVENINMDKEE